MTTTEQGDFSNYLVSCVCEWSCAINGKNDVAAANIALRHVQEASRELIARQNQASVIDAQSAHILTHPVFQRSRNQAPHS